MQTFKFEELTDPAKEKARQWYAQNTDDYWAEPIIEHAKEEGKKRGFDIDHVQWRGFWSQGGGASWSGRVRLIEFIDYHLKPDNPDFARYTILRELLADDWVEGRVPIYMHSFHYVHSGYMRSEGVQIIGDELVSDAVICKGILEGAAVQQLFDSLDVCGLCDSLDEWALDEAKRYADDIYKQLEKEYDYEISDEHIQETADINGWRFDADGTFQ